MLHLHKEAHCRATVVLTRHCGHLRLCSSDCSRQWVWKTLHGTEGGAGGTVRIAQGLAACTGGGSNDISAALGMSAQHLLAAFSQRTPLVRGGVGGEADDALHARHRCRLSLPMRRRQQPGGSGGRSGGPPRRCGKQLSVPCCYCRTAGTAGAALQSAAQTVPQAEAARRSWAAPGTKTAVPVVSVC